MRIVAVGLMAFALTSCGTERSTIGFFGPASSSGRSALTLRVVDDPAGAVNVTSSTARPSVSLLFEATVEGSTSFNLGAGQIQMTVPLDSAQANSSLRIDSLPASLYTRLALRLVSAQLAIPGDRVPSRDMLGNSLVLNLDMSLDARSASGRTLVIDLNSAQWLRPVSNPPPGEPAYVYDGAAAFLSAIRVRTE